MKTMAEREIEHLRAGMEVMYGYASDADIAAMLGNTMQVKVNGKVERREIDYVFQQRDLLGRPTAYIPMPYPVHADNEFVVQTVDGQTTIIK